MKLLKGMALGVGGLLLLISSVLVLGLLAVQLDAVGTAAFHAAVARFGPADAEIRAATVSGSWIGGIELHQLVWLRGADTVRADRLSLDWSLPEWRVGSIVISSAAASGVEARLHAGGGSARGASTAGGSPPGPSGPRDGSPSGGGWAVLVEEFELTRATASIADPTDAEGGLYRVADLSLSGTGVRVAPGLGLDSLRLRARFAPPGRPAGWGEVLVTTRFEDGVLDLDTLSVRSPDSRVEGRGRANLNDFPAPGAAEWELQATPLRVADLEGLGFVPGTLRGETLRLVSRAWRDGAGSRMAVDALTSAGDSLGAEFEWRGDDENWHGTGVVEVGVAAGTALPGLGALGGPATVRLDGWLQGPGGGGGPAQEGAARSGTGLEGVATVKVEAPGRALTGELELTPRSGGRAPGDSLSLTLASLTWGDFVLDEGRVSVVRPGRDPHGDPLDWALGVRTAAGGHLVGEGTLRPGDSATALRYEGHLEGRALQDPRSQARLSGRVHFEGSGTRPEEAVLTIAVGLQDSRIGAVKVEAADVEARWDRGELEAGGGLATDLGGGAFAVTATTSERGGRFELRRLAVDSLSVAGAELRGAGRGSGSWTGGVTGFLDPTAVTARFESDIDGGRMAGLAVDSARLSGRWAGGRIDGVLEAAMPDSGRAEVRASVSLLDTVSVHLREGRLDGLNLASLLSGAPPTRLNGTVSGDLRLDPLRIDADLHLSPSLLLGDTLRSLQARVEGGGGRLGGHFSARLGGGFVDGEFTGRGLFQGLDDRGDGEAGTEARWDASMTGDLPRAGGLLGQRDSAATVRFDVNAQGGPEGPCVTVRAEGRGWGIQVDTAVLAARLLDSLLVLDTVGLQTDWVRGGGRGEVPLALFGGEEDLPAADPGNHVFELRLTVPDSARPPVGQGGESFPPRVLGSDVQARAGSLHVATECSTRGECRVTGGATLTSILYGDYSAATLEASVDAAVGPGLAATRGEGRFDLRGLRSPSASIRSLVLEAEARGDVWEVEGETVIDDGRDARLTLEVDPGPGRVWVRDLAFRMDEDRWRLADPGAVEFAGAGVRIDILEMVAGDQRVLVGGGWDTADAGTDLTVELDSVRVGTVSDLAGAPGLDGWVDARVRVRGSPGDLRVQGSASGELTQEGEPLHGFQVDIGQDAGLLGVELALSDPRGRERVSVSGDIPLDGDELEWNLDLRADSVPLPWLEPYVPDPLAQDLAGSLEAALRVEGARPDPVASGRISVDSARIGLPLPGITLTEVGLEATLDGRRVTIDALRGRSVGLVEASGEIRLPTSSAPAEMDLDVEADGFIAVNTSAIRTVVDGAVKVEGTAGAPEVSGDLTLPEAVIRLDEAVLGSGVDEVTLSDRDWETLRTRFGIVPPSDRGRSSPLFQTLGLDLEVTLGRDLWVRQQSNPEMQIQFTGGFKVEKEPGNEELRLDGELEAIPQRSYLEQFGRRFELDEGVGRLRGPVDETEFEVTSIYDVPPRDGTSSEVAVRLTLQGQPGDLSLTLSSDPAMENADIVSYLATGRPASQAFGGGEGQGTSAADVGADLVASRLTSAVEAFALESVGLDVLEVQREGLREATLVAGQYVTPELFLGFRQPVAFGSDEASGPSPEDLQAQLEWQAYRWLLLHLETGGSAFRFFLQGSYGF